MYGCKSWAMGGSVVLMLMAAIPAAAQVEVYSNTFEGPGPVGAEWSAWDEGQSDWVPVTTDTTPGTIYHPQDKFLGQFANDTVRLRLTGLPEHAEVTVGFDLYVIRSWDGNGDYGLGPDFWGIDADVLPGQEWDWATTFSNFPGSHQSFPAEYVDAGNHGDFEAQTGAIENNKLGFVYDPPEGDPYIQDAVYHTSTTFAHVGGVLEIRFGAMNLQDFPDETWGLDDVSVLLDVPEPGTCMLLLAGALAVVRRRR